LLAQLLLEVPASSMASERAFSLIFLLAVFVWRWGQNSRGCGGVGDNNDRDMVRIGQSDDSGEGMGRKSCRRAAL